MIWEEGEGRRATAKIQGEAKESRTARMSPRPADKGEMDGRDGMQARAGRVNDFFNGVLEVSRIRTSAMQRKSI